MPLDQRVATPRRVPRARWVRTAILGIGGLVLVGLAGTPPLLGASAYHGVVMGSKYFLSSFPGGGLGWGTPRPKTLFNGGDPSGYISKIKWTSWGGSIATGSGMNPIFRPQGGYYPNPVKIQLRASSIGICYPGGPRALATRWTHGPLVRLERPTQPLQVALSSGRVSWVARAPTLISARSRVHARAT